MPQPPFVPADRGVTAVEAVVVAGLLAALSLIGVPALLEMIHSAEVRGAAVDVANGFRRARSQAVAEQRNVILVIGPVQRLTAPQFCWQPPGDRTWAMVEDVEGDCKIGGSSPSVTSCSADDVRLLSYGPVRSGRVAFAGRPLTQDPIDIGGAPGTARYRTLCFQPRGYVSRDTELRTGVYVGNPIKDVYRKVEVNIAGQVKTRTYRGSQYE